MEWEQVAFCQWRARGKDGEFTVWKDGRKWKGKYRSVNGLYTCIFEEQKSLRAIKKVCEYSKYASIASIGNNYALYVALRK